MAVSMGLSFHNSIAVIQGFRGKKSSFVRTPKYSIISLRDTLKSNNYLIQKIDWKTWTEALICLYFIFAIGLAFRIDYYSFLMFHIMLMFGFGINFFYSLRHLSLK